MIFSFLHSKSAHVLRLGQWQQFVEKKKTQNCPDQTIHNLKQIHPAKNPNKYDSAHTMLTTPEQNRRKKNQLRKLSSVFSFSPSDWPRIQITTPMLFLFWYMSFTWTPLRFSAGSNTTTSTRIQTHTQKKAHTHTHTHSLCVTHLRSPTQNREIRFLSSLFNFFVVVWPALKFLTALTSTNAW